MGRRLDRPSIWATMRTVKYTRADSSVLPVEKSRCDGRDWTPFAAFRRKPKLINHVSWAWERFAAGETQSSAPEV